MKKLLIIAAITASTIVTSAQAAEKELSLQEQIRLDAQRDPYAETPNTTTIIEGATVTEIYIEPAAADQMQPSKVFVTDKQGNIKIKN